MVRARFALALLIPGFVAACSGDPVDPPVTDTTPPTLVSTLPADGAQDVPASTDLRLTFSEAVSRDTGLVLVDPGDTFATADGTLDEARTVWKLNLPNDLPAGAQLTVTVMGFEDDAGNVMAAASFGFTVQAAPDLTAPEVSSATPAEGAVAVPPNLSTIRITFNEAMDTTAGSAGLSAGAVVEGLNFSSPTELQVSVSGLGVSTDYALSLTGFTDLAGNDLDTTAYLQDGALDFRTADAADTTAPQVVSSDPAEGALDVDLSRTLVTVVFSEPMDVAVGQGALDDGAGPVASPLSWSADQQTATFTVALAADTDYKLTLTGFADIAGNPLDGTAYLGDGVLDFRVPGVEDVTPPTVITALPAEGTVNVPVGVTEVSVTFDEPMNSAVTDARFEDLTLAITSTVSGVWSGSGTTLTFDVAGRLALGRAFRLDLRGFTDVANNALDPAPYLGDGWLDFSTPADTASPTVLSTVPAEGAQDVLPNLGNIVVTFDEAVDAATVDAGLSDGASTIALVGALSADQRQVSYPVAGLILAGSTYRLLLTGVQDLAGNPLNGTPYLVDGALDFTAPAPPTGFDCTSPLTTAFATSEVGGTYTFDLPAVASGTNGSFACDVSTGTRLGNDFVIEYVKQTDTLANGGQLLHAFAQSGSSVGLNVEVLAGSCDAAATAAVQESCFWNKTDLDVYLDVPAGTYWIWVGRTSSGNFQGGSVQVEEIPPSAAEGEGCWLPWTTLSANYTPPATAADAHVWTIPATAVNAFDMDVTWGGIGSISCDDTAPYGDIHGVDTVVEYTPQSAGILQVTVTSLTSGGRALDVEILDRCVSRDPGRVSLGCSANAQTHELVATSTAPVWIWVATEATSYAWPGAEVSVRELNPGLGESCATGRPIASPGTVTLVGGSAERLGAPACLTGTQNLEWYRYTATGGRLQISTTGAAELGIYDDSTARELGCAADASSLGFGRVVAPGTTVCIAVPAGQAATTLTVVDGPDNYSGVGTTITPLMVTPAVAWNTEYWMAASPNWLYFARSGGDLQRMPKSGMATAVEVFSGSANMGWGGVALTDERLFSLDQTTSATLNRVFQLWDGQAASYSATAWDTMTSYPTQDMRAFTYDGSNLVYATNQTSSVEIYSLPVVGAGTPTLLGSNATIDNVVGMAADVNFYYFTAQSVADNVDGLYRIPRATPAAPATLLEAFDINTGGAHPIYLDDVTSPNYLYVREASPSALHVIESPDASTPILRGATLTLGGTTDYAWTYDRTTNSIFWYETETDSAGRIVQIQ